MTQAQVVKLIQERRGRKSVLAFSKELGVSQPYLDRVLKFQQVPGEKILKLFGLQRIMTTKVTYRAIEGSQSLVSKSGVSTHGSL
jgi:hypothetical protein